MTKPKIAQLSQQWLPPVPPQKPSKVYHRWHRKDKHGERVFKSVCSCCIRIFTVGRGTVSLVIGGDVLIFSESFHLSSTYIILRSVRGCACILARGCARLLTLYLPTAQQPIHTERHEQCARCGKYLVVSSW